MDDAMPPFYRSRSIHCGICRMFKKSKVPVPSTTTSTTLIRSDRITTSSSTVVSQSVSTTKKKAKREPEAENISFSAFSLDEDESAKRDAALNSPIKGKKRLTTKVRCSKSQFMTELPICH